MDEVGRQFPCAAVFGASGGIGAALLRALAAAGVARVYAGARTGAVPASPGIVPFHFDYDDPTSLSAAAETMAGEPPQLVVVATGALTLPDGTGPERSYRQIDPVTMERVLLLNTVGPALIAKHMLPLFARDRRCVFAALSARVGSIGDNRIGGWHSYRASKAALNMLVRNFAIELRRTHRQAVAVALHPGTVDTALSEPFQANVPDGQLTDPGTAAHHLLEVIARLTPADSGHQIDWRGERVPD